MFVHSWQQWKKKKNLGHEATVSLYVKERERERRQNNIQFRNCRVERHWQKSLCKPFWLFLLIFCTLYNMPASKKLKYRLPWMLKFSRNENDYIKWYQLLTVRIKIVLQKQPANNFLSFSHSLSLSHSLTLTLTLVYFILI